MLSKETVIHLLQNPRKVADHPEDELHQLAEAYPYSQPLQLLYAARLRYSNEHLFQRQLGRTALITNDRSVLFELFEEQAPLQEQAQQVSESRERDEVAPAEWAPASRPNEPASEEQNIASAVPATPLEGAEKAPEPEGEPAPSEPDQADQPSAGETPDDTHQPQQEETANPEAEAAQEPEESSQLPERDSSSERPPRPTARESGQQLGQDQLSERMKAILDKSRQLRQRHRQEAEDKLAQARQDAEAPENEAGKAETPPAPSQETLPREEEDARQAADEVGEEQQTSQPTEESTAPEENQPRDSKAPSESTSSSAEAPQETDAEDAALEEQAQIEAHEGPAEEQTTLTTSETVDDGQPERLSDQASSEPEEETIDQKLRSIRQRLEQIQSEETSLEEEPESLEGTALQKEAAPQSETLLTTGELAPEPKATPTTDKEESDETAARDAGAPEKAPEASGPSSEEPSPSSSLAHSGDASTDSEIAPEDSSEADEDPALDQEFLEIEALIDQYRQEEVPRLVDEPSATLEQEQSTAEEAESSSEEPSPASRAAETESQPHSFTYWLKRLSGKTPQASSEPKETAATPGPEQASSEPATSEAPEEKVRPKTSTGSAPAEEKEEEGMSMEDKLQLLDSFVEKLPELKKKKPGGPPPPEDKPAPNRPLKTPDRQKEEDGALVTETLAKVYIRQKHYKKAIQAYEILKLKYPEKSSFFAGRIAEIKELTNSK